MWIVGPIGFTAPWLLAALAALPILWLLLRAVPPAPVRRRFPGVALLLGLTDDETEADRTPWWLLLLRMLAVAALIIGFAGPVLNPERDGPGTGPLLILSDGSWADARDWPRRQDRMAALLTEAGRAGRPVAVLTASGLDAAAGLPLQAAEVWQSRLAGIVPRPWLPDEAGLAAWIAALPAEGFETYWLSDGLDWPGRADLLAALEAHGAVRVFESPRQPVALTPAEYADGEVRIAALRAGAGAGDSFSVRAIGPDPAGIERELARADLAFAAGETRAEAAFDLPPELRNRIQRFEIEGVRSAGAVSLADDALRRREIALVAGPSSGREGLELLLPLHYLKQALAPSADLIEGAMTDLLLADPDAVVLADVARLSQSETDALSDWIEKGGLLLRFAGPRLAASAGETASGAADPLLPVRLRPGGRSLGGAMSWGEARRLAPFPEGSPFHGLAIPEDVEVGAQVLAEPAPDLSERTIAALEDGTPLVTSARFGQGEIVLFHVTANAEWSNLPLSGLFVQMLDRLAVSTRAARPDAEDLAGTTWQADRLLDGFGALSDAGTAPGVPGEALTAEARPGPDLPPGLYVSEDRRIALNAVGPGQTLAPAAWPARIPVEGMAVSRELPLKGWLLVGAVVLLLADILATLAIGGRLRGPRARRGGAGAALMLAAVLAGAPDRGMAQSGDDALAIAATREVVLAHVLTGDAGVDDLAEAGLRGLSAVLTQRTAVEPAEPMGIDLETDELAFFPLLYWPVTEDQRLPSEAAYARLNTYLRTGGMIVFDTRDGDLAGTGAMSGAARRLQIIAAELDIPPLEPVPPDHVLTRAFYLLQDFPGRYVGAPVWVEAAPPDAAQAEGMPFRDLNDGVTPVVIGGNDWAGAWALDARGLPLYPVGRGFAGERQREIAYRFGVNLVMHVLTGNYKSDQVHVPALLERLGQ